jgi:hypothetical protein
VSPPGRPAGAASWGGAGPGGSGPGSGQGPSSETRTSSARGAPARRPPPRRLHPPAAPRRSAPAAAAAAAAAASPGLPPPPHRRSRRRATATPPHGGVREGLGSAAPRARPLPQRDSYSCYQMHITAYYQPFVHITCIFRPHFVCWRAEYSHESHVPRPAKCPRVHEIHFTSIPSSRSAVCSGNLCIEPMGAGACCCAVLVGNGSSVPCSHHRQLSQMDVTGTTYSTS